ncbi:MAG: porin family protein [Rhizobiales bacterium]|nr:porin family protein [Hyphomicrobiales bacterium]
MSTLRVCLVGTLFLCGLQSVRAADVADIVAQPPLVYDWSGYFIGLNGGEGFADDESIRLKPDFQEKAGHLDLNGLFGGAQVGANWQTGNWVLGVEADLQLSDIIDSDRHSADGLEFSSRGDIDWYNTVRIRAGYAIDNLLIFGTGGLALGGVDYKVHTVDDPSAAINLSDSYTASGWTAGAGVEWGFSANSSAKIEYLFTDLGKKEIGNSFSDDSYFKASPSFQSIRMGVDFRF